MSEKLSSRINSGLATVKQWESDKELLTLTRDQIPFDLLCPKQYHHQHHQRKDETTMIEESPYAQPGDDKYQGDDLLLKRLALYFKKMMTWVNNPSCELCGSTETKCKHIRGPISPEERQGQATRVEVYWCPTCNAETTLFPRYNQPRKLLETKKGRCGEYANLFGLYCRAAGFDTRYVLDFTDHVWTEVYSHRLGRWIMCDGCEGVIDEPSMYEHGWGKDLNCILAFTTDSVVDVTRRYTRKFQSQGFQTRRRAICPEGDFQSEMVVAQFNAQIRHANRLSRKRVEELDKRMAIEQAFFEATEKSAFWEDGDYSEGRQSGSLAWKIARGEAGIATQTQNNKTGTEKPVSTSVVDLSENDMANLTNLTLRCENNAVPSKVSTRLPDSVMPLATQQNASFKSKTEAFLKFVKDGETSGSTSNSNSYIGFCTKQGLPLYLISKSAYPLQKSSGSNSGEMAIWKTFHFVPKSLSGEADTPSAATFDVPVNEEFFTNLLGNHLAKNEGGRLVQVPTISSLNNSRLVAFYFSAHWCPPCRRFTPMLCEAYLHLKSMFPVHGLELVFVSSDRDSSSFNNYLSTMPWLAVPFDNASIRRSISQRFDVQGIPALVVLDTVSGNIIVSKEVSKSQVNQACQGGDDAIETMYSMWVDQIPEDSKAMIETLKLSCIEEESEEEVEEELEASDTNATTQPPVEKSMTQEEFSVRVRGIFQSLVAEGLPPNEAGAKALLQANEEAMNLKMTAMEINDLANQVVEESFEPKDIDQEVVSLIIKYISNIEQNPCTPKYRLMKLGNKIFDQVTVSKNALGFIEYLGFQLFHIDLDFVASVPLSANVSLMKLTAQDFLSEHGEGMNTED